MGIRVPRIPLALLLVAVVAPWVVSMVLLATTHDCGVVVVGTRVSDRGLVVSVTGPPGTVCSIEGLGSVEGNGSRVFPVRGSPPVLRVTCSCGHRGGSSLVPVPGSTVVPLCGPGVDADTGVLVAERNGSRVSVRWVTDPGILVTVAVNDVRVRPGETIIVPPREEATVTVMGDRNATVKLAPGESSTIAVSYIHVSSAALLASVATTISIGFLMDTKTTREFFYLIAAAVVIAVVGLGLAIGYVYAYALSPMR